MAITRAQQAKQMLQLGGRIGLQGGGRDASSDDFGGSGNTGGGGNGRDTDFQQRGMSKADYNASKGNRGQNFGGRTSNLEKLGTLAKNVFNKTLIGRTISKFGPKSFTDKYGYATDYQGTTGPSSVDDDDDTGGEGEGIRLPMTYNPMTTAASMMNPMTPQEGIGALDLNRIAYRFMADGGFLEDTDEARQAYGLGSIVKKAFKTVRKPFKAVTKTLKKVAKSPTGRLLLAVAAPYALGPAVASSAALGGLSAAQQAALISAATTGITQVASGEDLDFKDIALSAALSGAAAKALPPGGSQATGASKAASASKFQMPRGGGADFSQIAASSTRPNMFDIAGPVKGGSGISNIIKNVTPEKSSLFSTLGKSLKNIGTKGLDFAKENPLLTIAGASGLAGLMAKREEQEEPGEVDRGPGIDIAAIRRRPFDYMAPRFAGSQFDFYAAEGGQAKKEPVAKKVMPLLDMGGMEKDYRAEGGFVPIGRMEKADDVPARLSKNEFVFTADAVRNAGDGDVDKGAEVMYNMMKNLEAGGDVSEESQGLEGARRMFQTSQRLEEVL